MKNLFERYKDITNIDIEKFFNDFSDFLNFDYQKIVNYYEGSKEPLEKSVVSNLLDLKDKAKDIINSFSLYKEKLSKYYDYWELLDQVESVRTKLDTISNSDKWFRSNKSLYYNNEFEKDYVLKQGQTLSNLADELGYEDPNNDWVEIAQQNSLREDDYDIEGGSLLTITFQNNANLVIQSVIGGVSGEKVYGKDLNRTLSFQDADEDGFYDLKTESYKNTIFQAYEILIGTFKGSIPEFPNDGINKGLLGGNRNAIQYPVLFRQLANIFSKDDTFKNFQITGISRSQDKLSLDAKAVTRIGEVLEEKLEIV
jgi:hypothetical protein